MMLVSVTHYHRHHADLEVTHWDTPQRAHQTQMAHVKLIRDSIRDWDSDRSHRTPQDA